MDAFAKSSPPPCKVKGKVSRADRETKRGEESQIRRARMKADLYKQIQEV